MVIGQHQMNATIHMLSVIQRVEGRRAKARTSPLMDKYIVNDKRWAKMESNELARSDWDETHRHVNAFMAPREKMSF